MKQFLIALICFFSFTWSAVAVQPHEVLDDPVLEERARDISAGLRCLVCQNQSIDDSNADLAADLRVLVRERLVAGDSNDQVMDYVVARYGEYVLLTPVLGLHTLVLWVATPLVLGIGLFAIVLSVRRRTAMVSAPEMNEAERQALEKLMEGEPDAQNSKHESRI